MSDEIKKIQDALDEKIPRDAVRERWADKAKTMKLSYVEGHYVIDRLNKVFGHLNWASETTVLQLPDTERPSYQGRVRITVRGPNGVVVSHDGIGYGSDKSGLNPHEFAMKEAETDALKRAAMKFGMSMGLALYDKSQENVSDEKDSNDSESTREGKPQQAVAQGAKRDKPDKKAPPVGGEEQETLPASPPADRKILNQLLSEMANVLNAQRKLTFSALKALTKEKFGADNKEALSDAQAQGLYSHLRGMLT
jgi:recombination DNA repair RAD52 pathway protein